MPRGVKSRTITVFLLKDGPNEPAATLRHFDSLTELPVSIAGNECGRLFVQPSEAKPPSWLSLFRGAADLEALTAVNSSTAAIWLTSARGKTLALAFGYGRNLLRPGCWEEDFGLRVTLNAVDSNKIKTVDRMTLDAISQQSRIQASRDASITEFGLDVEQDLLRAVIGTPVDSSLGARLTGRDALQATVAIRLADVPALLERYLDEFSKEDYRTRFPWVEQIHEVNDRIRQAELDILLIDKLRRRELRGLWLAVPEMMDWEGLGGFRYRHSRHAVLQPDIHAAAFLDDLDDPGDLDAYTLKRRYHVYAISSDNEATIRQWPVYRCLYCEVTEGGESYLLNNGRWFRIATDFVQRVNEAVASIPEKLLPLPPYSDQSEAAFCRRVERENAERFALMDQKLIRFPGLPTTIEFCDLFSTEKEVIHLKRYTGSSGLSHLFSQGLVSARLFLNEPAFRQEVDRLLPPSHHIMNPEAKPDPQAYEIVFGIISQSRNPLVLPFFSRVNLKNISANLREIGYKVAISKVAAVRD